MWPAISRFIAISGRDRDPVRIWRIAISPAPPEANPKAFDLVDHMVGSTGGWDAPSSYLTGPNKPARWSSRPFADQISDKILNQIIIFHIVLRGRDFPRYPAVSGNRAKYPVPAPPAPRLARQPCNKSSGAPHQPTILPDPISRYIISTIGPLAKTITRGKEKS